MRTVSFDARVTALSSIQHNGGASSGISSMLRREKFVQPNKRVADVPVISGNSFRGILRDVAMKDMLKKLGYGIDPATGIVKGLPLSAFYFLTSGGALTSTGEAGMDIHAMRKMRDLIPQIGLFGGAIGNAILKSNMKIGKLIPICKETLHLLPKDFQDEDAQSIWDYCQRQMYVRTDDEKNESLRELIDPEVRGLLASKEASKQSITKAATAQQMMYNVETIAAGTQFYWKVELNDPTDIEFEAFVNMIMVFSKSPYIGGRSAIGHGEIALQMGPWIEVDSRANLKGKEVGKPLMKKYLEHMEANREEIKNFLENIK